MTSQGKIVILDSEGARSLRISIMFDCNYQKGREIVRM